MKFAASGGDLGHRPALVPALMMIYRKGMHRIWIAMLLVPGLLWPGRAAFGQIDPEARKLFQFGFNQPLQGASPVAGYMFYYYNQPDFYQSNLTLRLAVAPVYLDSELGISGALGPNTDLGLGLAGGGFADSYFEFRDGKYYPSDSFEGHSAELSGSIYHLFNPGQRIPLSGILRLREHYSIYDEYNNTSPAFVLPHDHSTTSLRAGLRWGGREPVMSPALAMEISAWYEAQFRTDSGNFGYNGDRVLEPFSQLAFARVLLNYTLPDSKQRFSLSLTGGGSGHADRFSAYRLGGNLPLSSEFPLLIPGYFYEELSATDFVNLSGEYSVPLDPAKHWRLITYGAVAEMDYLYGLSQPGHLNSGAGLGLAYQAGSWQAQTSYGYGFQAMRDSGRGGQEIGILVQFDLAAHRRANPIVNPNGPNESRGLIHFLQNMF
jgi:hypothetical protein